MFSVCTVAYGPHTDLLRKLLDSIVMSQPPRGMITDLRIGLNDVSPETFNLVMQFCGNRMTGTNCYVYVPAKNVGKYPLMRRMFYDQKAPLAKLVMWFDDDSHLGPAVGSVWWQKAVAATSSTVMIGRTHALAQRRQQYKMIPRQPWFGSKHVHEKHVYFFVTGGWWVTQSTNLTKFDYPWPDIHHNGGDSMLGEMMRQQGIRLANFQYADCHCDACLGKSRPVNRPDCVQINVGGLSGRRGIGKRNEFYVWQDGKPTDRSHQIFDCTVYRFQACSSTQNG